MNNIFLAVKEAVTARQAAEAYGIPVNRNGMVRCPFHEDHHPSMKIDERYYCFGCHETGDVIDFTAKLFGLSLYEAARKLAADFNVLPACCCPLESPAVEQKERAKGRKGSLHFHPGEL